MVVMARFFSSAVASAWGAIHDMLMHKCLKAPGLGTVVTDAIELKVDGGDSTVLLKCRCECLGASHDTPMHKRLKARGLGTLVME